MPVINIVFAADDGYTQHLAVSIASLLDNVSSDRDINISIIDRGISKANLDKILTLTKIKPCTINIFEAKEATFKNGPLNKTHTVSGKQVNNFTLSVYDRLLIPFLLDKSDKAIYLDSDIIVQGDISLLWDEKIGSAPICAVETPIWPDMFEEQLNKITLTNKKPYFNSGVMLMNLEQLRKVLPVQKSQQIIKDMGTNLICHDQDILNIALQDLWKAVHPKYNVIPQMTDKKKWGDFYSYTPSEIEKAVSNPLIVHYASHPKPWNYGCVDSRRDLYFKYLEMAGYGDYQIPAPSLKQRAKYYKESTGLILKKYAPFIHKLIRKLRGK